MKITRHVEYEASDFDKILDLKRQVLQVYTPFNEKISRVDPLKALHKGNNLHARRSALILSRRLEKAKEWISDQCFAVITDDNVIIKMSYGEVDLRIGRAYSSKSKDPSFRFIEEYVRNQRLPYEDYRREVFVIPTNDQGWVEVSSKTHQVIWLKYAYEYDESSIAGLLFSKTQ